jgi:hypothetical protein
MPPQQRKVTAYERRAFVQHWPRDLFQSAASAALTIAQFQGRRS